MAKSADAFRTISEVADWLETPAHVLRFWESKFSQVKPVKRAGGRRYYRPADMQLLGGIKKLLHEDGMTIKGVQKMLREQGVKHVAALSQPLEDDGYDISGTAEAADTSPDAAAEAPAVLSFNRAASPEPAAPEPPQPAVTPGPPATDAPEPVLDTATEPATQPEPTPPAGSPEAPEPVLPSFSHQRQAEPAAGASEPMGTPAPEPEPEPKAQPSAASEPEPDSEPAPPPAPAPIMVDVPADPDDNTQAEPGILTRLVRLEGPLPESSRDAVSHVATRLRATTDKASA